MITVIIPCFNAEKTILRALHSVLEQSKAHLIKEIIIVDDCSTDRTLEVIQNFDNKLVRVLSLDRNTGSAAQPRNEAILKTTTEGVAFLDSDDSWDEFHLEETLNILEMGADLVCSNATKIVNDSASVPYFKFSPSRQISTFELIFHNPIIMSSVVCQKKVFYDLSINFSNSMNKDFYNDYLVWYKISTAFKLRYLNKRTLTYYVSDTSDSALYANPKASENKTFQLFVEWAKGRVSKTKIFVYKLFYVLKVTITYLVER
jgi:glycosyltransferase involved in cell wall biosynthesis